MIQVQHAKQLQELNSIDQQHKLNKIKSWCFRENCWVWYLLVLTATLAYIITMDYQQFE